MELPKLPKTTICDTSDREWPEYGYTADQMQEYARQAVLMERERCCGIIFGMCESDNVAQRTVDKIRLG